MTTTVIAKNKAADALTPATMTIHSAAPGALGNDNIIDTPKACTFGAAANGVRTLTNQPEFTVPAGVTVAFTVTKDSAGDMLDSSALATPETYANGGTHRISSGTITVS